jgi:hypothetical protein
MSKGKEVLLKLSSQSGISTDSAHFASGLRVFVMQVVAASAGIICISLSWKGFRRLCASSCRAAQCETNPSRI